MKSLKIIALAFSISTAGAAMAADSVHNNGELYSVSVQAPASKLTRADVAAQAVAGNGVAAQEYVRADAGFRSSKSRQDVTAELSKPHVLDQLYFGA